MSARVKRFYTQHFCNTLEKTWYSPISHTIETVNQLLICITFQKIAKENNTNAYTQDKRNKKTDRNEFSGQFFRKIKVLGWWKKT